MVTVYGRVMSNVWAYLCHIYLGVLYVIRVIFLILFIKLSLYLKLRALG